MSFKVTLMFDCLSKYFSENKVSHILKRLPANVELREGWEVDLMEFMHPYT